MGGDSKCVVGGFGFRTVRSIYGVKDGVTGVHAAGFHGEGIQGRLVFGGLRSVEGTTKAWGFGEGGQGKGYRLI